jgi:predicted RNA-binding Zn ribbon-like protein
MNSDWRNGFLFVGNQLALDFVNTRPVMNGQPVEMLPDGGALARWLEAAGLVSAPESARLIRRWSSPEFTATLEEIRELRENLRRILIQIETGASVPASFIKQLNRLLLRHPAVDHMVNVDSGLKRRRRFAPELPEDALAPLADAMADLLTTADRVRIRKCPHCVLHFYDTSKKGTRVWCSMNLCGNRSKVAAYAGRQRAESPLQKA